MCTVLFHDLFAAASFLYVLKISASFHSGGRACSPVKAALKPQNWELMHHTEHQCYHWYPNSYILGQEGVVAHKPKAAYSWTILTMSCFW